MAKVVTRVKLRRLQQIEWVALSAVIGTGLVAGGYWFLLQQHYPFMPGSGSLKLWWDNGMGFIHSGKWPVLRHGLRNLGEPAAFTIVGAMLLLKAKDHPRILPAWLLVTYGTVLALITIAATIGITYAINFTRFTRVSDAGSWKELLAGLLLGFLLKRAWSPVTGTLRYHLVSKTHGTPLWVRFPLLSPAVRQEWLDTHQSEGTRNDTKWYVVTLVTSVVLLVLFVAVVGNVAKYGAPHGHVLPGMTTG